MRKEQISPTNSSKRVFNDGDIEVYYGNTCDVLALGENLEHHDGSDVGASRDMVYFTLCGENIARCTLCGVNSDTTSGRYVADGSATSAEHCVFMVWSVWFKTPRKNKIKSEQSITNIKHWNIQQIY